MHPIVIIGSGMAGYAVAREFRKLNTQQELVMVCADDAINYAKPTLSNALLAKKSAAQIALADAKKMSAQLNMRIETQSQVTQIDTTAHQIHLSQNGRTSTQAYAKLILALGATPIQLALAGDAADAIHRINHLTDYQHFRQQLEHKPHQRVLILGAGLIGCEFANDLQTSGHQVTVVDLAEQALAHLLPADVAQQFQKNLANIGIDFIFNNSVKSINQNQDGSYTALLANGQSLLADLVLSAVGLKANTQLAQMASIKTQTAIQTNQFLQTSQNDIYAVGDCAEVNGLHLPYVMPIMQQARALAKSLNGEHSAIHYPAMPVAVKTPASPLTILPLAANIEVTWQSQNLEDGLVATALDQHGTLRAFVLLGATAAKQRLTLVKQVPDLIPVNN